MENPVPKNPGIWQNPIPKNPGIPGFCKIPSRKIPGLKFLIPLRPGHRSPVDAPASPSRTPISTENKLDSVASACDGALYTLLLSVFLPFHGQCVQLYVHGKDICSKSDPVCFLLRQEPLTQKSATPQGFPPPTQSKPKAPQKQFNIFKSKTQKICCNIASSLKKL